MTAKRKHCLGWEDGGLAALASCDGVAFPDPPILHAEPYDGPDVCPRCGATLKLVWHVYVEEVPE